MSFVLYTMLLTLSPRQGSIDKLLPDGIGLPDLTHRGAGFFQWHALPEHAVKEHKGGDTHIGDTVDKTFLVLRGVHSLEEACQIRLSRVVPDHRDMDVFHALSNYHIRLVRQVAWCCPRGQVDDHLIPSLFDSG